MIQPSKKIIWKLFVTMLYISAFTFGGGFVIITFMKRKFVDELHWLSEEEMLEMTALAQTAPGAIAVNAAILVGSKMAGIPGIIAAVLGTVIPPFVILSVISLFYSLFITNPYIALVLKGMQAGIAAVILNVVCDLGSTVIKDHNRLNIILMAGAFVLTVFFNVNAILIIAIALVIGIATVLFSNKKKRSGKKEVAK